MLFVFHPLQQIFIKGFTATIGNTFRDFKLSHYPKSILNCKITTFYLKQMKFL